MKSILAVIAGFAVGIAAFRPEPTAAQAAGAAGGKDGLMIVGTAGDTPQVNNLIYVVHRRPVTEREKAFLTKIDPKFPDERTTLSVYRINLGGVPDAARAVGKLLFMRDISWDEMMLGSDQLSADSAVASKHVLQQLVEQAEKKK